MAIDADLTLSNIVVLVLLLNTQNIDSTSFTSNVTGNITLLLGGLFSIHESDGSSCGEIRHAPFRNVEAMVYAVDRINADPDLLPNISLGFDIRDTCGLSNKALEETVSLMDINSGAISEIGISGVIGPAQSDTSILVASLLRVFQIPQISHASTAKILSDKERFDYFFRTIPSDGLQAKAMADIIAYFNWTYVIAINSDDTYGRGGINSLKEELSHLNVCVVTRPDVTSLPLNADDSSYANVIRFIDQKWKENASVIVLFGQRSTAEGVLRAFRDSNLPNKNRTWIASDAWTTRVPVDLRDTVSGMLGVVPDIHSISSFDDYFSSLHPSNYTTNPWFTEYWNSMFNRSEEESAAIKGNGVGYVIDAVYAFAHAIHDMINISCMDDNLCQDILTRRFSKKALNGTILRKNLFNVSFISPSSNQVSFDSAGDQQSFYEVRNLGLNGQLKIVGTWNLIQSLQFTEEIYWSGGGGIPHSMCSIPCGPGHQPVLVPGESDCCWTCDPCQGDNTVSSGEECIECVTGSSPNEERDTCMPNPLTFLTWSNPWGIFIIIGASVGILATSFVTFVFIIFNRHRVIKASSRELSAILLTGIMLCYILPFFYIATPSPGVCAIRRFGIGFCFSLCFSPLLMKTNRIYRVFHKAPRTARFASSFHQVLFSCGLILIQVLMAVLWLALERPSVEHVYGKTVTELICGERPYIGLSIFLGYNLLLLVLSTYYAFRARNIPATFNETKFISITLYTVCIIWLGFIPTYFGTIKLGTVYQTASLMIAVLLTSTTTLGCLFFPKVLLVFIQRIKDKPKEEAKSHSTDMELPSNANMGSSVKYSLARKN